MLVNVGNVLICSFYTHLVGNFMIQGLIHKDRKTNSWLVVIL
jgi:hypothetical protein